MENFIDWMFNWWICFPLQLSTKVKSRASKTVCFLLFFVWLFPAVIVGLPVLLPCILIWCYKEVLNA